MSDHEVEADWLQDTLADVAVRLRQPAVSAGQLATCAATLERIVADLREPDDYAARRATLTAKRRKPWLAAAAVVVGLSLLAIRHSSKRHR